MNPQGDAIMVFHPPEVTVRRAIGRSGTSAFARINILRLLQQSVLAIYVDEFERKRLGELRDHSPTFVGALQASVMSLHSDRTRPNPDLPPGIDPRTFGGVHPERGADRPSVIRQPSPTPVITTPRSR
jgi:hypothetical protein